jgi:hypothetical protein
LIESASGRLNTMQIKSLCKGALLAASTLSGAALASTHIVNITWAPGGRFAHQAQIAAGKFVEVCGKLAVADSVKWSFTAAAPVDFNIHYHVGKETVFPVNKAQIAVARDTLNVTVAQDYCWMWTNKGPAPVDLKVELVR